MERTSAVGSSAGMSVVKGNPTISIASPALVTLNGHGLATGDCIELTTTGALPDGLAVNTNYFVIYVDANSFRLAITLANALAGAAINVSGSQSGTHSLRYVPWSISGGSNFILPDMREAAPAGVGTRTAWVTDHDTFGLGVFKDDQSQGHRHGWDGSAGRSNATTHSAASESGYAYPYADAVIGDPATDGVNGTPRTGAVTRGKRIGVNYIIKH